MEQSMIKIDNVSKQYRLGAIGGGTLQGDLQTWWALKRGKEDPNSKIGSKVYAKNEKFMALDGVSFEVKKGERVGIIGHNGAGKSTLLKLLSRVTAPTSGEIKLNGRVASMLEVGTGFHGELTGRENIYMNGAILGMTRKEIDAKMEDIIEFSECRQFIDTPVKRYSSGMYVKLAFSVAAHLDSEIMIMDEVLAVGDMAFQKKCLEKMSEVSKGEGRTILYVSHNMNTIRHLCERVVVLSHGKIIFNGDVEEGINYYMNSNHADSVFFDLSQVARPYSYMGEKAKITNFRFTQNKTRFTCVEKITFQINVAFRENLKDIRLRIEICYADATKLGIFESETISSVNAGLSSFTWFFDPSMLPRGKYYINLDLYGFGDDNTHQSVDHPLIDIPFEIINEIPGRIVWNHSYMGHVRFGLLNSISTDESVL